MLVLRFNYKQMAQDLCIALVEAADEIIGMFMNDVAADLKENDFEEQKAVFDVVAEKILAGCVFYAHSILESYGRGSLMDIDKETLADYMNSEFWNPSRNHDKIIVGRPKGQYIDFFGEDRYSSGNYDGIYLEHRIPPIAPSYAIQNAEKRLSRIIDGGGYGFRVLEDKTKEFFETMDSSKYFYNIEV